MSSTFPVIVIVIATCHSAHHSPLLSRPFFHFRIWTSYQHKTAPITSSHQLQLSINQQLSPSNVIPIISSHQMSFSLSFSGILGSMRAFMFITSISQQLFWWQTAYPMVLRFDFLLDGNVPSAVLLLNSTNLQLRSARKGKPVTHSLHVCQRSVLVGFIISPYFYSVELCKPRGAYTWQHGCR